MAAFKQHIAVSSTLGAAYTASCIYLGTEWSLAALGGMLCALGGMLPDLDSDSGRPVAEIFGITAAILPMLLLQRLRDQGLTREAIILCLAGCYLAMRFGAPLILGVLTVHRGMFHSIPAALIAAEIVFLAHKTDDIAGSVKLALGVLIGFLSHLVMDELWSVNLSGMTIRLNKAAGSALKLWSPGLGATLCAYLILAGLSYLVGVREGYFAPVQLPFATLTASTLKH
jgi:LexA-binding, inner membrane-associated putative hydrolase